MASKLFRQDAAHKESILAVSYLRRGTENSLLTGSVDETVCLWKEQAETKDNLSVASTFPDHNMACLSIATHKNCPVAVTSSMDCRLRMLDLDEGKAKAVIDAGPVECWTLSINPSGDSVASGTHTGAVNIWDIETGKREATLESHGEFALSVAYDPNGKVLASSSKDGTVYLFDLNSHKIISTLTHHTKPVRAIKYSADGSLLYAASDDLTVSIYDPVKSAHVASLRGHLGWVLSLDVSADKSVIATGSADNTVKIWNVADRTCTHTFDKSHTGQVYGVSFNHDGTRLASVGGEGTLQTYSVSATPQAVPQ